MTNEIIMTKHIPSILLTIVCTVLAIGLYQSNREIATLEGKIAELERAPMPRVGDGSPLAMGVGPRRGEVAPGGVVGGVARAAKESAGDGEGDKAATRRMMNNLSKMLDNPSMNKVLEASQRGALQALYGDLMDSFDLTDKEKDYFTDLLMSRQMKQMNLGMKMMGGEMSDEEKQKMGEELEEIKKAVKDEMKSFLNDDDDYAEYRFYEKTMNERMMLSQMTQELEASEFPLSDEVHRELLTMMHDERKNFDFSNDLHDNQKVDLSAGRFSEENLQQFSDDMDRLNRGMIGKAGAFLTAEQLEAFEESVRSMAEMQKSQMEMAAKMFRGGR